MGIHLKGKCKCMAPPPPQVNWGSLFYSILVGTVCRVPYAKFSTKLGAVLAP
jgi:hypothetical protein